MPPFITDLLTELNFCFWYPYPSDRQLQRYSPCRSALEKPCRMLWVHLGNYVPTSWGGGRHKYHGRKYFLLNNPSPASASRRLGGCVTPSANAVLPPLLSLMILAGFGERASCPLATYVECWSATRLADGALLYSLLFLKEALKVQNHIQMLEPGFSAASFRALYPPSCMERKIRSLQSRL